MKKKFHYIMTAVLAFLLLLCISIPGVADEPASDKAITGSSLDETLYGSESSSILEEDGKEKKEKESLLSITMLDVGQGLSLLLECDGHFAVYDGGGRDSSSYVVSYLKHHRVETVDYMFVSHYDEDHIAGLNGILNVFTVEKVICPEYKPDTKIYKSFETYTEDNQSEVIHPDGGDVFELGGARIRVILPKDYQPAAENENSIAVEIKHGKFSCLVTGDASSDEEEAIVKENLLEKYTLLVAGHHGSDSSTCEAFLKAVSPEIVFISCGQGNTYGHPSKTTMKLLEQYKCKMYRTDLQGEVSAFSNSETYLVSVLPCQNYCSGKELEDDKTSEEEKNESSENETKENSESKKIYVPVPIATATPTPEPEPTFEPTPEPAPTPVPDQQKSPGRTYILNTNTYKFHYPGCGSVSKMKDKNKLEYTGSREDVIGMGYSPCGNCHP